MHYLTSDGVSLNKIKQLAKMCRLPLWPSPEKPFLEAKDVIDIPDSLYVIAEDITELRLRELFELPIESIVDAHATQRSIKDFIRCQTRHKYSNALSFLLTGPIIYKYDIASVFAHALWKRIRFSDNRRSAIHLAIHEALVNGLIHGNLQLSSALRQTTQGYVSYSDLVAQRLDTPAFARKAISISAVWNRSRLEIKIRDEGMGYSLAQILKQSDSPMSAKSGRGLRMIACAADSCTIENYGKEITLFFLKESTQHIHEPVSWAQGSDNTPKTDLSDSRVLIIEDNKSNQALLAGLLTQIGINKIEVAADGIEGLNKVLSFMPDLIILDITMPRMDGYEVLQRLKSVEMTRDIPILIQTASDTREARDRTFKAGASDFITKPINPLEFFARVRVHLENRHLVESLRNQLKQINHELLTAQDMQRHLLPAPDMLKRIRSRYGLNIDSYFIPSAKLGGDFWQLFPLSQNRLGIYLCDFSGHGLAAALNTFRMHTLIFQQRLKIKKPSDFLKKLNDQLYQLLPRGQFATFFCGIFDMNQRTLSYAGAGSPPPFLKNQSGIHLLATQGLPLGISLGSEYDDYTIAFGPGDKFVLYSDALTESPSQHGLRLGEEGLLSLVKPSLDYTDLSKGLSHFVNAFFNLIPPPPQDDVSVIFVEGLMIQEKKK